ncbi:ATP-dependent endonuclease [Variovorax sp. 770b2]|uniref:ATP-dependent nuclease n=1 Tax=Variovorax sp. 770b2 TaxID=1566271 RepID=UPI0008E774F1|nr:AAA family ATPase [Variovorax sp. 770b2]SFQ41091.1 putative ATP-dependent endonuclease of the OLD family [Variovorax sp. 770b2]
MYLHQLRIQGFRRFNDLTLQFKEGLNVIIGPNNGGKTAVVDALRVLLSANDEGNLRLTELDLHQPKAGARSTEARFTFAFRGLKTQEEADFITALKPFTAEDATKASYEASFTIQYTQAELGGRLKVRRWVGDHEENALTTDMLEELRAVYLQPLRDPASGLKPGRFSQLSKLLHRLSQQPEREKLQELLKAFDEDIKPKPPLSTTNTVIGDKHKAMLGPELAQLLDLELSPSDFARFAARIGLSVAGMEVEQNGLGFNNLIFMAVVLSELSLNNSASYCGLIVEEPEAHLHPQLQAVLLDYLKTVEKPDKGQRAVQVFVTSHSPNFAALADIDSICCVYESPSGPAVFAPRDVEFGKGKKEKLQRYLNVTRAELFFARRLILVEGTAELFIVEALAKKANIDLRKHSVSIISTDGLNFDCFLPLFGKDAMQIPVAVITDADPAADVFPTKKSSLTLSPNALKLQDSEDEFIQCFFAKKTLEYDLALERSCRMHMLSALKEMHPVIGKDVEAEIDDLSTPGERAKALYCGMFQRGPNLESVQKGRFAQLLAFNLYSTDEDVTSPDYLTDALDFVVPKASEDDGVL